MKTPWPWYSESRSGGGWFVKLSGDQHFLGKHPPGAAKPAKKNGRWNPPNEILTEFYALMSVRDTGAKQDYSVETICALYLDEIEKDNPGLAKRYKPILGSFCDFKHNGKLVGKLLVNAELDVPHLKARAKTFPSLNTRRTYINCCKAALEWAVERKQINVLHNPLKGLTAPKGESRAEIITEEEHEALIKFFPDSYQDFLKAMWVTGARPGEIAKIEARHFKDGLWRLSPAEHKTGDKTKRDRMIGVVGELEEIVKRLCKQHPEGPIFLNTYGEPWTTGASHMRFKKARKKGIILYRFDSSRQHAIACFAIATTK
jgi:integrase